MEKDRKFEEGHKEELDKKWEEKYNTPEMKEKSEEVNKRLKEIKKFIEENPEIYEQEEDEYYKYKYLHYLEGENLQTQKRLDHLEKTFEELKDLLKKDNKKQN